jgi:hypothetical protein
MNDLVSKHTDAPWSGLSPLDEDRAASMADEGGWAAAEVEKAEEPPARGLPAVVWFGVGLVAALTIAACSRRFRS